MYLVVENETLYPSQTVAAEIYEVEGYLTYERAHAGSDYEYFELSKIIRGRNNMKSRYLLGSKCQIFENLKDAEAHANSIYRNKQESLRKRITSMTVDNYVVNEEK